MKEEIIKTLKDLLKYKTQKDNKKEFNKIFNYIKNKYINLYISEYEFNNNKALVLANTKSKKLDIIFCTHIDVVSAEDYSFKEDKDNIYGRGTIDMKGSVAVCLEILKNIKSNSKIALLITSDEEVDGNCTYQLSKIYDSNICIVPDGGSNFDLIVEEKGLIQLKLSTKTSSAHSSQLYKGENAIIKLINVYNKIIEKYPNPKSNNEYITSTNLSKLIGGYENNQVPYYAEMILDIRNVHKDNQDKLIEFIKKIDKDVSVEVITLGDTFKTNLNDNLVKKYIECSEKVLNKKIHKVGCESTSDAIFFQNKGIPTVIMNPKGDYPHSKFEYINKDSLLDLYNIYKLFIEEYSNEKNNIVPSIK